LQLHRRSAGLAAGLLVLVLAPPALAGPTVTIRVEGKDKTLAEEQQIPTPDGQVPTSTGSCNGSTALGALHAAVAGDWSGNGTFGTEFVERIRDEDYPLGATPDGWTFWVNNKEASVGPCEPAGPAARAACARHGRHDRTERGHRRPLRPVRNPRAGRGRAHHRRRRRRHDRR
jgi:hypothetical protein